MEQAFRAASPRWTPAPTPLASALIHGGVMVLWLLLFARAFGGRGILAWSTGIVYVGYDTLLLGFVFWQTLALLRSAPAAAAPPGDTDPAKPGSNTSDATNSLAVIVAAHNRPIRADRAGGADRDRR
jgi:hypothetical protein